MNATGLLDLLVGGADPVADVPLWLQIAFTSVAFAICIIIGVVDARHRIIPDSANAALAVLGLALAGFGGMDAALAAGVQGLVSFGLFWAFQHLYRLARGVQGLGFGDVKFMGAAGIWVGLGGIAPLILIACVAAIGFVIAIRLRGTAITGRTALPFGPFLALGLVAMIAARLIWPSAF